MKILKYPELSVKKMFAELKANKPILSVDLPDHKEGILQDQEFFHQLV